MSKDQEQGGKPKLSRKLLYWVLPGILIPTVLVMVLTKGSDLGQAEADKAELDRKQQQQEQRLSARVSNPEEEATEALRKAREAVEADREKQAQEAARRELPLPPPPGRNDIETKAGEKRQTRLKESREVIASTLNDSEQQSTGLNTTAPTKPRSSFVVYTAPGGDGVLNSGLGANNANNANGGNTGPDAGRNNDSKKPATTQEFLKSNDDKVAIDSSTTLAKRVDSLYWLAPGTIVRAVLINAVNTQIPGQITAKTTEPIYDSRYGRYLVIPAGSTLIGEYSSTVANGQDRVMMGFRSLVTPSGGTVDLAGVRVSDQLGRVGVEGELHTQTLRRMGIAFLFALESVGMDRLTKNQTTVTTSGTTSTTTNSSEAARIISEAAKQDPRLRPVQPYITIDQGQLISIVTTVGMEIPPIANRR